MTMVPAHHLSKQKHPTNYHAGDHPSNYWEGLIISRLTQADVYSSTTNLMDAEQESRTNSVNEAGSGSGSGSSSTKHFHGHDPHPGWLQLGLGPVSGSTHHHHHHHKPMDHEPHGTTGLTLELNLGGGGAGSSGLTGQHPQTTAGLASDTVAHPLQMVEGGPSLAYANYNNMSNYYQHHDQMMMMMMISNNRSSSSNSGWGMIGPNNLMNRASTTSCSYLKMHRAAGDGAAAAAAATAGPSSSSSGGIRIIDPPPKRSHSGLWFLLQASPIQAKEPFLPQVPKSYLRIKDGRMTVGLVIKYLVNKLGLDSESEVEITCRGQQLVPVLTLQHVRDNIWSRSSRHTTTTLSSPLDHVMVLHYGRINPLL